MSPVLTVHELTFTYAHGPIPALDRVGFSLESGEIVGLIGPNGSGKSTLLKNIVDLLRLQSGTIRVGAHEHTEAAARDDIIFLASNDYLPEFLSGWEYLTTLARLYDVALNRAHAEAAFERYSMPSRLDHLIEDYSHGMRKKTQLVAAHLMHRPLTIIDETLNGIDLEALHLWEQSAQQVRHDGRSMLLCSHDFTLLERLTDRILFLDLGERVAWDSTESLVRRHGSLANLVFNHIDQGRD